MAGSQVADFLVQQALRTEGKNSWLIRAADLKHYDLSAKNPTRKEDTEPLRAVELIRSMKAKQERIGDLLDELDDILGVAQ